MNAVTGNTTHAVCTRRGSCPWRTWPGVRPLAIDMISIDAPGRVSEEFRAYGVLLTDVQQPCPLYETGTSLILPSVGFLCNADIEHTCRPLPGNEFMLIVKLIRPDHWMILIVRLDRALIAMPRRDARQVQQTVQQTGIPRHINQCIFNSLRASSRRASPPYGAPRCNKL